MAKPKCTVEFVRGRRGWVGRLMHKGVVLDEESLDFGNTPQARGALAYALQKQCKERVAAVFHKKTPADLFFRTLDTLHSRRR